MRRIEPYFREVLAAASLLGLHGIAKLVTMAIVDGAAMSDEAWRSEVLHSILIPVRLCVLLLSQGDRGASSVAVESLPEMTEDEVLIL